MFERHVWLFWVGNISWPFSGVDKKVILWDIPEARPAAEFTGHTDTVHSLRFSRDGHILASGLYGIILR